MGNSDHGSATIVVVAGMRTVGTYVLTYTSEQQEIFTSTRDNGKDKKTLVGEMSLIL